MLANFPGRFGVPPPFRRTAPSFPPQITLVPPTVRGSESRPPVFFYVPGHVFPQNPSLRIPTPPCPPRGPLSHRPQFSFYRPQSPPPPVAWSTKLSGVLKSGVYNGGVGNSPAPPKKSMAPMSFHSPPFPNTFNDAVVSRDLPRRPWQSPNFPKTAKCFAVPTAQKS